MNNLTTPHLSNNTKFDPFAGPEIASIVRTTQAQKEVWIACQLGGKDANRAYNESISLILKGALNQSALEQALNILVERHDSLRAVFSTDGRFMSIFEQVPIQPIFKDISNLSVAEKENSVKSYLHEEANHLFNLVEGPLLKVGLLKISEEKHQLVLTAHHIICDGWSLGIMLQELGVLYSAYVNNETPELPEPESFSDYADGQQALAESNDYEEIERFWLKQYQKPIPQLDLPIDFLRPQQRTYKSERLDFLLDTNLVAAIKKTGLQAGCSFVTTFLAAFEVFLYRYTGQENIVVGLPAAGQSLAGMKHLIGHCANLLPLRSSIHSDISFNKFLKKRKSEMFDAYENQQISFGELLKKLSIPRDPSRVPLVPVVFNIDLGLADDVSFSGLTYELKSNPREYEIFEIFLNASGSEEKLLMEWSYNTSLFKPSTIKNMMVAFENVLQELTVNPTESIATLFHSNLETAYTKLNATTATHPKHPLHVLLAKQATSTPNRVALKFKDYEISYKNLHERANQLAHYFISQGAGPGDFIGVCIPRSSEMLISLLAILKCGAAYLPLDPSYPRPRLEFMLEDSEAKFLITSKDLSTSFSGVFKTLEVEKAIEEMRHFPETTPKIDVSQEAIAYLLYTSGSTGKPKGVQVTHKNLVNLLYSIAKKPGINENDRFLAITTISFDISAVELYLPLLKGACIVLADTETARDGRLLLEMLKNEEISILQATPTTWNMLLNSNWEKPLNLKAFCGGESLSQKLAEQLLSRCDSLWNMYGPTETTIYSILKQILNNNEPICIGKPIDNTQLYILNEQYQLVETGVIGEIAIAGDGLSNGYWKRPELNKAKFIKNPDAINANSSLYLTGDLGILLPTGEIKCLGRIDNQVKIRGHRIELGEIEQVLAGLEEVQAAVVLAQNDRLVAYIVPTKIGEATSVQIPKLRKELAKHLPSFQVPQEFKFLETLNTTPNGKVDRKALEFSKSTKEPVLEMNAAPCTPSEKLIANIWQKYLELEEVGVSSNFFELGGHSIIAVQVMARIEKETGKRLPVAALFEYSTIEKLAMLLDLEDNNFITGDSLVHIKANGSKPPLYLIHGVGLNILKLNDLSNKLDSDQPVYGLQGTGVNGKGISLDSVEAIAEHYIATIIKINPEGPYSLAGHSYGGIIAYEMARQLVDKGKKVQVLIMLDTYLEPYFHHSSKFTKKIAELEYFSKRMVFTLKEMSKSWTNFKFYLNRKKEKILNKYSTTYNGKNKQQHLEDRYLLEVQENNNLMMKRYHIVPQNFEIHLLRAKQNMYFMHDPVYLGWKDVALKGLHIHEVPGNHLDMVTPPNDLVTGGILQSILHRENLEE